jgi:hypothetical protein
MRSVPEFADPGPKLSKTVLYVSALELLYMTRQIFNPGLLDHYQLDTRISLGLSTRMT